MKIAVIVETREWGGLEMHSLDLVAALNNAGHHACIVCIGETTWRLFSERGNGIAPLTKFAPPARRTLLGWMQALRTIDADGAVLQKGTLRTGSVSLDLALRARFRQFITVEHLEPPQVPAKASRRYLFGLIPGIALWWYAWKLRGYLRSMGPRTIVCVSDSVRRALASAYHFPERKLVTVRNGVNVERFRADVELRHRMRTAWGVPENAVVFGSVRRFVHEKGLDVAIEAFAGLARKVAEPGYLVLVGEGPEQPALDQLATDRGVRGRVIFPGFTSEPWAVYSAFDVFLIPSRVEALGVVVAEASASGCLVIGSDVGGIPEMMPEKPAGSLVPAGDVGALTVAMEDAMRLDPPARVAAAAEARRHVLTRFEGRTQYLRIGFLIHGNSGEPDFQEGVRCT